MIEFIQEEMMKLATYFLLILNNNSKMNSYFAFQKILKVEEFLNHQTINHFCFDILKKIEFEEKKFESFYLFKILDKFSINFSEENIQELDEVIELKIFELIEKNYLMEIRSKFPFHD